MRPLQMAASNDAGRARVASIARLTNLYVQLQSNPNADIKATLISCPGARKLFEIQGDIQITGIHATAEKVFFTTRKGLYELVGQRYVKRADLTVSGRVSMDDNGIDLVIVDGYNAHAYTMSSGALNEIEGLPNCNSIRFIDGYFLAVEKDTNRIRCSSFYSTDFPADRFANCEGSPDNCVGVAKLSRLAYFFNQKSIEPWYNTGEDFPFSPSQSAFSDRGCYTAFSYVETDQAIYFLGDDKIVYRITGYQPERISTHSEEYDLSGVDCSGAWMETYSHEGHDFVLLQVPGMKKTLCYDASTRAWHDRQSGSDKHFSNCMITLNGVTYVGDRNSASISVLDHDIPSENGQKMTFRMITPKDMYRGRVNSIELVLQKFSVPSPEKLRVDMTSEERMLLAEWPAIGMQYTDDDGQSWSSIDGQELPPNSELVAVWNKLGYAYGRSYMFTAEGVQCIWAGLWAN